MPTSAFEPSAAVADRAAGAPRGAPLGHAAPGWVLTVTALGVVYGDIGTSPLYAIQAALKATGRDAPGPLEVLGIVSLVFWALMLVVSLKYVAIVLCADNEGEGGILALLSLVSPAATLPPQGGTGRLPFLVLLGTLGAGLLYGDGVITPAISVLSALEGLRVAAPGVEPWIVPATCVVLVVLFAIQSRGTGRIGKLFSPVMIGWFAAIGIVGGCGVAQAPEILLALDPRHAARFLITDRSVGFAVFGYVFLALTGAEALYADMGHVGAPAIRRTWFGLVLPALLLSYFGQGALVLAHPDAADNPFYKLAPAWALLPLIALATAATAIASQALISGAFSLTQQAIQMQLCPRMTIRPTSSAEIGQVYVPLVNWTLMAATIVVVLAFKTSHSLAAAYGVAVSGTMLITTVLLYHAMLERWRWPAAAALGATAVFGAVDVVFLAANGMKIVDGGWVPLALGAAVVFLMTSWRIGSAELQRQQQATSVPFVTFLAALDGRLIARIPGCAVFLTRVTADTSPMIVHHVDHNRVLHEHVVLLTIVPTRRPAVPARERLEIQDLGHGFHRVLAKIGFMQIPDVSTYIKEGAKLGLECCGDDVYYYVTHEALVRRRKRPRLAGPVWLAYAFMSRNALRMPNYLRLPPKKVMEIGLQIEL